VLCVVCCVLCVYVCVCVLRQQDLRDVSQLSLRGEIGVVPQDTVLFNDSIECAPLDSIFASI